MSLHLRQATFATRAEWDERVAWAERMRPAVVSDLTRKGHGYGDCGVCQQCQIAYSILMLIDGLLGARQFVPCAECHDTGTSGERAEDGAPLVCTACQGGRRP